MKYYLSPPEPTEKSLELKYVSNALKNNQAAAGRYTGLFENAVRQATGAQNALAVTSGTSAIHLALMALGIGGGDPVFVSAFTSFGSVAPAVYMGAEPVFIDSDKNTWNMDPNLLEDELKRRSAPGGKMPKAVLLTHAYGQPADMDSIYSLCDRYGLHLIEDAAESLGAQYSGRYTGTFGRIGIYSFGDDKIVSSGGGGVLVSDDSKLTDKARCLAGWAKEPEDGYETAGYNYRISNMQCAHGYAQMQELDKRVEKRRSIFEAYRRKLDGAPVTFMPEHEKGTGTRWLTTLSFEDGDAGSIAEYLRGEGIETRPLWRPLHLHPVFRGAQSAVNGTSEELFEYGLCLPSGGGLTDDDISEICGKIVRIL